MTKKHENIPSHINIWEVKNKTTGRYHYISTLFTKMKWSNDTKFWWWCQLLHWKQSLWKNLSFSKFKDKCAQNPAIALWSIHLCRLSFITVIFFPVRTLTNTMPWENYWTCILESMYKKVLPSQEGGLEKNFLVFIAALQYPKVRNEPIIQQW